MTRILLITAILVAAFATFALADDGGNPASQQQAVSVTVQTIQTVTSIGTATGFTVGLSEWNAGQATAAQSGNSFVVNNNVASKITFTEGGSASVTLLVKVNGDATFRGNGFDVIPTIAIGNHSYSIDAYKITFTANSLAPGSYNKTATYTISNQ